MALSYFWDAAANTVITSDSSLYWKIVEKKGLMDMYCMDTACASIAMQYGRFSSICCCWEHVPLNQFPKEFRAHLLLLT